MKIALIIERAQIDLGGAERSLFELFAALRSAGCNVEILAAKGNTKAKHCHILCQDLPGKRTPLLVFEEKLKEFLAKNPFDIVHSFLPFEFADVYQPRGGSYPEAIAGNAASYQNSIIRLFKKSTASLNHQRSRLAKAERYICTFPKGPVVAALSDYVAGHYKKHYGLFEDRIKVIRNGVFTDKTVNPTEIDKLRSVILSKLRLTEADRPVFFLFATHNFRLKGLAQLISALQMSAGASDHSPYLIIVGSGNQRKYIRLAKKLNIKRKILFYGPAKKIDNLLAFCDVAVLPTFYDPSSRFILEALAMDKPVITTKFNGATELFTNNRHGRIIDIPQNTLALAEAISYFTNPDNINKASAAIIKDNLREQISISRVAKELKSLYDSISTKRKNK
ncbi:MAG: glycosyltransferase family 4 protein [Sedimentisphaerales bacterium]|nr:glycosyltransferase family 4 protein [Sedimentisphaerales bacterium]